MIFLIISIIIIVVIVLIFIIINIIKKALPSRARASVINEDTNSTPRLFEIVARSLKTPYCDVSLLINCILS